METPTTIEFIFKPGSAMKVKVTNVQGPSCTETTKALEALGSITTTTTPEFHEVAPETIQTSTAVETQEW